MVDRDLKRAKETLEEILGTVLKLQVRHGIVCIAETLDGDSKGPEHEVSQGREEILIEIDALGGFN